MMQRKVQRGFTLIELLVVVSIVALLISILLPAVGNARTAAKVSVDIQNMKQHGVGTMSYAAANNDTLPNGPLAPPSTTNKFGIPGRLAQVFATDEFPVNGFKFPSQGIPSYKPILAFGNGLPNYAWRWDNASMFNAYFIVMSEYMTDGEGIDALHDVFFASGDAEGREFLGKAKTYLQLNKGQWPSLGNSGLLNANFQLGSFRYVGAAMLDPKVMKCTASPSKPDLQDQFNLGTQVTTGTANQSKFYQFVTRVPNSAVTFPSSKVLYFTTTAFYTPNRDSWFEPQALSPLAAADGSARGATPENDALLLPDSENPHLEDAGTWLSVVYVKQDDEGKDVTVAYRCPYMVTYGGIRGRDLK